ncbi:MAG: DinB family protein [Fimbriimonadaceae bacterium]|nr:DinB family protein [Fimbriimonadaceae bacterium]
MIPRFTHHWPMVRRILAGVVAELEPGLVDAIPPGCRNSLRWQLGHVVWSSQWLLLFLAGEATPQTADWDRWFGFHTAPGDFTVDTPTWTTLLTTLDDATPRLTRWLEQCDPSAPLAHPMVAVEMLVEVRTVGDAAHFAAGHESYHLGQINVYRRILGA